MTTQTEQRQAPVLTFKEKSLNDVINSGIPEAVTGMAFVLSGKYNLKTAANARGELDWTGLELEMVKTGEESENKIGEYRCYTKGARTICTEKTVESLQAEQKILEGGKNQQDYLGFASIAFGMAIIYWGLYRSINGITNYVRSTMKANKELMKG